MIPHRLVRTVPAVTSDDTEKLWDIATNLHPSWEHVTWRDPVDTLAFPLTSPYWDQCETGAQLADLIRAEDLFHRGGWYIDSDMWMLRPLDSLCSLDGVAGWEDHLHIPNAVLGFAAGHDALRQVVDLAIARQSRGTWEAGVGVTTEVFRDHPAMTLLPPGAFYPVHWREAHRRMVDWNHEAKMAPWAFGIHKYAASWHT
jgi:hypothetical protein